MVANANGYSTGLIIQLEVPLTRKKSRLLTLVAQDQSARHVANCPSSRLILGGDGVSDGAIVLQGKK